MIHELELNIYNFKDKLMLSVSNKPKMQKGINQRKENMQQQPKKSIIGPLFSHMSTYTRVDPKQNLMDWKPLSLCGPHPLETFLRSPSRNLRERATRDVSAISLSRSNSHAIQKEKLKKPFLHNIQCIYIELFCDKLPMCVQNL